MHFGGTSCQIYRFDFMISHDLQAGFKGGAIHHFLAVGTGVYMAVCTHLIAHITNVNLKNAQVFGTNFTQSMFLQFIFKGGEGAILKNPIG